MGYWSIKVTRNAGQVGTTRERNGVLFRLSAVALDEDGWQSGGEDWP